VLFWGLASRELNETIELYATRAEAEQALVDDVVADEPDWKCQLFVTPIELAGPQSASSLN
jgi:hypothetical protein